MTQQHELVVFTSPAGKRYLDLADIARIAGLPAIDIDNKYRPSSWASPRDFVWDGRRIWYAILSLQQLIDNLIAFHLTDAAQLLHERLTAWQAAAVSEQEAKKNPAPEPAENWITRWEAEHE